MPTGIGGEVGWWCPSLDDAGNGTTTLNDLVGSNTGTLTNFALTGSTSNWVADTNNGGTRCLAMDGTNDYVACGTSTGDALGTLSAFSFSCWFKITSATNENGIFQLGNFANDYGKFWIRQGPTANIVYGFNDTATSNFFLFADTTAWHHLSVIYNGENFRAYVDDVLKFTTTFSVAVQFGGKKTTVGGYYSANETFGGRLDDLRVWSRALTATENTLLASRRAYQPASSDFQTAGMFGGMSGAMTGGMES